MSSRGKLRANADALRDMVFPEVIEELREIIGLTATLTLVEYYGGTQLFVPSQYNDEHLLVRQIGARHAAQLIERFEGERLYMPRLAAQLRQLRNREIWIKHYERSIPVRQLALEYGLSDRQIWNILSECDLEFNDPQTALF